MAKSTINDHFQWLYGGFHQWGYPKMAVFFCGKSENKMDINGWFGGTPLGNLHISLPESNHIKSYPTHPRLLQWIHPVWYAVSGELVVPEPRGKWWMNHQTSSNFGIFAQFNLISRNTSGSKSFWEWDWNDQQIWIFHMKWDEPYLLIWIRLIWSTNLDPLKPPGGLFCDFFLHQETLIVKPQLSLPQLGYVDVHCPSLHYCALRTSLSSLQEENTENTYLHKPTTKPVA